MKALIAVENTDPDAPPSTRLRLTDKPKPGPGPGEVLLRMEASPCNPSDLHYLKGEYGIPPEWGKTAGFEGCGTVVECGGGLFARWLKGKRVASAGGSGGEGVWAEYFLAKANACLPISRDIPVEQAASFIVNPFTAFGLLDRAKALKTGAVIQNAAASQVGKLVIRLAKLSGMPVISIVRREEQSQALQGIGAEHVLVSSEPGFEKELKGLAHKLKARVAFDCVGGADTARLLMNMPSHSTAIVFGRLDKDPTDIFGGRYPVGHMVFADAKIEGFWLSYDIRRLGPLRLLGRSRKIQGLFKKGLLKTDVQSVSAIEDFPAAMDAYAANMSAGKPILKF